MYGLIIEGVRFMIIENFGPQVLSQILELTQMGDKSISTHDIYSEHIVPNMLRATCEITGMSADQVGVLAGRYFVQFLIRHGYGDLMHVMGRRFSDFLKGLDNIHEYFRFSYPKIRPPSFYCSSESEDGLILHYRSRRQGYISYVIGQLVELARLFYKQELGVKVLQKKEKGKFLFVVIQLSFKNSGLSLDNRLKDRVKSLNEYLPVDTMSFLKMFPFHIAFNRRLDILMCGQGLLNLMPQIIGLNMIDLFDLQKPCIKFTAEGCLAHENCNFQLESLHPVVKKTPEGVTVKINDDVTEEGRDQREPGHNLPYVVLRGPIIYLKSCETFLLLATCVVDGLDDMFRMGLFLNDYGDADCNREIIMASIQKSDHLKNLLQSEKQRSQVLTEMTREISENKRKARQLLTQMMPVEVAKTLLRTGRSDQCESFECVTIAFVKVVDFPKQTDHMTAVEIVNLLNSVYLIFDEIVDIHGVYKVETIGESYMISAGVPYKDDFDTVIVSDCSLNMISKIKEADLKFGDGKKLQVKIGIFTGPCVGGIVGHKNPRYCLFGDTVNCASRMETTNKVPMTIQIGQRTKDRLDKQAPNKFKIKHRGVINVKGKGEMKIYEIVGKSGRPRYVTHPPKKPAMENDEHEEGISNSDDDHDRNSAMSRMSMGETIEPTQDEAATDFDAVELNNSIATILADLSATAQYNPIYNLPLSETLQTRNSEAELIKELEKSRYKPKLTTAPIVQKIDQKPIIAKVESEETPAPLEKEASLISLASSTIQARAEQQDLVSLTSLADSVPANNDIERVDSKANLLIDRQENGTAQPREHEVQPSKEMTTDFSTEPVDKVPVELPGAKNNTHHDSESTDPEELWKKDERFEALDKKKKKMQKNEMKSSRKILDSQKKKEPELVQKKILPEIKKKEKDTRDRPEKKPERGGSKKEHEKKDHKGHSHEDDPSCRCEDIREDPRLKTKVCSIQ